MYFLLQDILVKLVSSVRNLILWYVSLMLYQITGSNIPMDFATCLLSLMKWIVMMMNRLKKKNTLNINAVEIVEAGCFEVHVLHTFFIILPSSNILVKLQNLLTCRDKAMRSPSSAITRFHLQRGFQVLWAYTTGTSCRLATTFQ